MADSHAIAIALGSNRGDSRGFVRSAAQLVFKRAVSDGVLSSLYRTSPVDCPPDAADFINAVLIGRTRLEALELLEVCRDIEVEMGRPSARGYHEDRVIDLDLLLVDDLQLNSDPLKLPHPEMTVRRFVLEPLAEVAPQWIVPGIQESVGSLLERLTEDDEHVECIGH